MMTELKNFKNYLEVNGYASNTIVAYLHKISLFLATCKEINEQNINEYLLSVKSKFSDETFNAHRKAIKKYFEFANINIELPKHTKVIQKIPDSISEDYFLNHIIPLINSHFINSLKVKTILYFLYYTGVRKSELFALKRKDIDLESRRAKIYEPKKRKERMITFSKKLRDLVSKYFAGEDEIENAFNINRGTLDVIIQRLKPLCPEVNLRPHLFRHSFATNYLNKGMNIARVKDLLGHSTLNSTSKYTSTDLDEIQENIDKIEGEE